MLNDTVAKHAVSCKWCGEPIVWMKTAKRKNIPVNATGCINLNRLRYDPGMHVNHFTDCPEFAAEQKAKKRRPAEPIPPALERFAAAEPGDHVKLGDKIFVCLPDYPVTIERTPDKPDNGSALFAPPTKIQARIAQKRQTLQRRQRAKAGIPDPTFDISAIPASDP